MLQPMDVRTLQTLHEYKRERLMAGGHRRARRFEERERRRPAEAIPRAIDVAITTLRQLTPSRLLLRTVAPPARRRSAGAP